jgi:hypothetical protein
MSDNKGDGKKVSFDNKDAVDVFADIVEIISYDPETIKLNIAIKNSPSTAKVTHSIILTIPHFMRFADVCHNVSKEIKDKIEQIKKGQQNAN